MVQIKVLKTTPDLMERDVNQFMQTLGQSRDYNVKIIDTRYSTPHNADWHAIITYTMARKQQRGAISTIPPEAINKLIGSEP